jgi:hypothetical protein
LARYHCRYLRGDAKISGESGWISPWPGVSITLSGGGISASLAPGTRLKRRARRRKSETTFSSPPWFQYPYTSSHVRTSAALRPGTRRRSLGPTFRKLR